MVLVLVVMCCTEVLVPLNPKWSFFNACTFVISNHSVTLYPLNTHFTLKLASLNITSVTLDLIILAG